MTGEKAPCPACRAPLERVTSSWEVLACLACGGVWTDANASRRITSTVDRELVSIAKEAARNAADTDSTYQRMSDVSDGASRRCPVCAGTLACVRSGHVAIDVCASHGTWFDKDELGRLARNLEFERISSVTPREEPAARSRNAEMLLSILERAE
jgi:Zn-finger nucleic acid-binding protein